MLQRFKSFFGLIIVAIIFLLVAGCHRYYKVITENAKDRPDNTLDSLKTLMRYFVLRTPGGAYYMANPILSEDRKTLTCTLDILPSEHQTHVYSGRTNKR